MFRSSTVNNLLLIGLLISPEGFGPRGLTPETLRGSKRAEIEGHGD